MTDATAIDLSEVLPAFNLPIQPLCLGQNVTWRPRLLPTVPCVVNGHVNLATSGFKAKLIVDTGLRPCQLINSKNNDKKDPFHFFCSLVQTWGGKNLTIIGFQTLFKFDFDTS